MVSSKSSSTVIDGMSIALKIVATESELNTKVCIIYENSWAFVSKSLAVIEFLSCSQL